MNTRAISNENSGTAFSVDTTFVLFFLALEFGRSVLQFGPDGIMLGVTVLAVAAFPFFFGTASEARSFARWMAGRMTIAGLATVLGMAFEVLLGSTLPSELRVLPMTLLIAASMVSCYIQFYGFMRFRAAK